MLAPFPSRQSVGAGAVRRLRLRVPAGLAAPTLAAALTAGLVWVGLGLRPADLHAPFFYQADTLLIFPLVRSVVTDGWAGLWTIPHLGFPGVQEWYDFPVADWLHFAGLWALGRVAEPVAVYNLYFLLGYPLAAAAAAWAGRRLDLSAPAAVAAGVLYALLPFHQGRDIHQLFLSSYFVVPVTCVQAVLAARGRGLGWVAGLAAGLAAGTGGA